jgi:hypothetical protein
MIWAVERRPLTGSRPITVTMLLATLICLGGTIALLWVLPAPWVVRATLAGCFDVIVTALASRWLRSRYRA